VSNVPTLETQGIDRLYNSLMKLGDAVGREPSPDAATYTYAGIGDAHPNPASIAHEVVIYGWTANVVQTLDYFPFGGLRLSVSTSTNEKRKYIDQFSDDSGLSYLNARYYNPDQGQFMTEDPGDPKQQNLRREASPDRAQHRGSCR
jgi:RHS repeat-associated protein